MESGDFDDDSDVFESLRFGDGLQYSSNEDRESAMRDHAFGDRGDYCTNDTADDFLFDESDTPGSFPPKGADYKPVSMSTLPYVTVDKARGDIYTQYMDEHRMIVNMIDNLPPADLGEWGKVVKVAMLLFGPDSAIYRVFYDKIAIPFEKYAQFLATFFLVCRINQHLNKIW